MPGLASRLRKAEAVVAVRRSADRPDLSRYRDDSVGYARDVLGVALWERVAEAVSALLQPP